MKFTGHAWSNVRGYEAFWYEGDGCRHIHFFNAEGKMEGWGKKYELLLSP